MNPDSEPLQTVRAAVAYDGTDFCGFQRQNGLRTIGGELETALERVFNRPTAVAAAGRTDAGVHASGQVISFLAPRCFPLDRLVLALREHLTPAISLHVPAVMPDGWSSRFQARERSYVYLLHTSRERHALRARFYGLEPRALDLARMRQAMRVLPGRHDFRSFCGTPPSNGTERTVTVADVERLDESTIRFELAADGFLHRMVRVTVGTLIEIGRGQRPPDDLQRVLAACDRRRAGHTAAASGLYLAGVRYTGYTSFREPLT